MMDSVPAPTEPPSRALLAESSLSITFATTVRIEDCAQRPLNFAVIDEVDAILIDAACDPLILTGPGENSTDKYKRVNSIIPKLVCGEVVNGRERMGCKPRFR
jgi:hypothetical protein